MRKPAKMCDIEGCPNLAKYALYKTYPDHKKVWLNVCYQHEQEIGNENMARAGGRYEQQGVT